MAIAILIPDRDVNSLRDQLNRHLPAGTAVWIYPEIPNPEDVTMAVVWKHPPGSLSQFPNLKLVQSFGAGVEHLLLDPELPEGVPLARIVDDALTLSMRNYVGMAVLAIHKRLDVYLENQRRKVWEQPHPVEWPVRVGILGMGELGAASAQFLAGMGFEVWGYSQQRKTLPGVTCLSPQEASLAEFAGMINVLVCLLPLTPQTEGILNDSLFRSMPKGSYLINAARGGHLVEADLLRVLDEGWFEGAFLDVFREEPLPASHPFWEHPKIFLTPHSASVTNPDSASKLVAENYRRVMAGQGPLHRVEAEKGY
ncbi:MAG: glyoxylate/hydroxypyruvate reductase A [Haliscomenobacter sp.]|nr:glyoxylate/hydroxypyruvate reductase A [Haliscomenobacter sp.]